MILVIRNHRPPVQYILETEGKNGPLERRTSTQVDELDYYLFHALTKSGSLRMQYEPRVPPEAEE